MLISDIRKWTDLSSSEKADIISRMFSIQNLWERDKVRSVLVEQYGVSEWTINSLVAHETMRRNKNTGWVKYIAQKWEKEILTVQWEEWEQSSIQVVQNTTQTRVYTITSLVEITEQMREDIIEEFSNVIQDNATNSRYDFYQDIEAMSDYYNIDPNILEQFLKNRYNWLWVKLDELKNGRVLSEEEKMNIRLYVSKWVDEKDKKARRKEMAEKYRVSTYVIWAVTAWKLGEDGWVMLRKDGVWDMNKWDIDKADSLWLINWVQELPESDESDKQSWQHDRDDIIPEASLVNQDAPLPTEQILYDWTVESQIEAMNEREDTLSEEDVAFIQEFAWSFDLSDDEQRKVFLDDVFDLFPEATIDDIKNIIPDFPDDTVHANTKRSWEWMWALVNYNNEVKNKWRQKLKEFIDENTEKEKRKDMKVLCLPWIECLEIPLYLELGFRPENIIWVEAWIVKWKKDPELIARFQANAAKYWIQTRIWKLEKVLEAEETVFDIVSLDFLGPVNNNANHILEIIKYAHRSIVLTNFQGKREWKQQDVLRHFESKHDGTWKMLHNGWIDYMVEGENSGIELKETRDGLAIGAFVANATFQRGYVANYWAYWEVIPQIAFSIRNLIENDSSEWAPKEMDYKAIQLSMMNESYRLAAALTDSLPYKPKNEIIGRIHVFLRSILVSVNFVMQHKSYEYKWNNVPMLSDMIVLEGLDMNIFNKKYPELTSYIMKILMYIFSTEWIRGVKFQNIKIWNIKKIWRTIVCWNDGKIVATIDHLKFMNELWEFWKWYSEKNVFASKREQII